MGSTSLAGIATGAALCGVMSACQPVSHFIDRLEFSSAGLTPGRKLVVLPDAVWEVENCDVRPLPHIRLEQSDIQPRKAYPGNEITYKLSYTACVPQQPGYILGELATHIYFRGKLQSRRADENYPVETGKWVVNTKIDVPPHAEPGRYDVVAIVSAGGESIKDKISFDVDDRR